MGEKLKKQLADKEAFQALTKKEKKAAKKLRRRLKRLRNNNGHEKVKVATTSRPKLDGMSEPYTRNDFVAETLDMDNHGYVEPDLPVIQTVESKAFAGLILFGLASADQFAEESLHFTPQNLDQIEGKSKHKDILIDVMDAATNVSGHSILKLVREHPNYANYTPEEVEKALSEDKAKIETLYKSDFQVIFEGGRGVLSTNGKIANAVAIRYVVDFRALPQEIIDEAYTNPRVWHIGPRVNLAKVVSDRTDLIKKVVGEDMHDPDHEKIEMTPDKYHRVSDLIVHGKVDDRTMLELLRK